MDIVMRFSAPLLTAICLCPDPGLSQSPNQETSAAGIPESSIGILWPRFGLRLSLGAGRIESPNLAEALHGFEQGRFEQDDIGVSPGFSIEGEFGPHVILSLGAEYRTTQFRFRRSALEDPRLQDTWDISLIPASLRLSYVLPASFGPLRVALGPGISFVVSHVEYSSNYYTIDVHAPLFRGLSSTGTGWGGSVHTDLLLDIAKSASIELAGEYEMISAITNIEFLDPQNGVSSLAYNRTMVEMTLRRWSLSLGFVYYLL